MLFPKRTAKLVELQSLVLWSTVFINCQWRAGVVSYLLGGWVIRESIHSTLRQDAVISGRANNRTCNKGAKDDFSRSQVPIFFKCTFSDKWANYNHSVLTTTTTTVKRPRAMTVFFIIIRPCYQWRLLRWMVVLGMTDGSDEVERKTRWRQNVISVVIKAHKTPARVICFHIGLPQPRLDPLKTPPYSLTFGNKLSGKHGLIFDSPSERIRVYLMENNRVGKNNLKERM